MTTKKISNKLNFYLCIGESIKNRNSLPTSKSKAAINYYLKPLKKRNIIFKKGYGVWGIDWNKFMIFYQEQVKIKDGRKVKKYKRDTPFIRGHGYHFKIKTRDSYIWKVILKNKAYVPLQNGQLRSVFKGNKVWFGAGFIKVYFPEDLSFMGIGADDSEQEALYYLKSLITHIEHKLRIDLSFKGDHLITVDKAHYAKIEDAMAKHCNKNKERIHCVLDGKEWFVIDNSFNLNESETTGKESKKDMDKAVVPMMNSVKEYTDQTGEAPKFTDIATSQNIMSNNLQDIMKLAQYNEAHFKSHVHAVQELSKAVSELRHEVSVFKKSSLHINQTKLGDF